MKMLDFGSSEHKCAAGVDQEKQSHTQPDLTSESVKQENGKQRRENGKRGSCW